jgi:hypothetical protein
MSSFTLKNLVVLAAAFITAAVAAPTIYLTGDSTMTAKGAGDGATAGEIIMPVCAPTITELHTLRMGNLHGLLHEPHGGQQRHRRTLR